MKDKKREAMSNEQRAMSKKVESRQLSEGSEKKVDGRQLPEGSEKPKDKYKRLEEQKQKLSFIQRPEPIFERLKVPSNVIYLVRREDRWYTISDFPDKILALLGTNELATPYGASARAEVVLEYVQKSNLDKFVMVME